MQFTKAQAEAIQTHNQNLIVIAGAGSGKTRVLVERYLALLTANPDWPLNALVAITFTKKAAEEMRDRVRHSLEDRYNHARSEADAQRWSQLLGEIDSARIDTIHGLCASLLRANAAEIGVDPAFDVLDEIESAILLEDVVDDVLAWVVSEDDPAVELLVEYGPRDLRAALTDPALINLELGEAPDDLNTTWADWYRDEQERQIKYLLSQVDEIGTFTPAPNDKLGDHWQTCLDALDWLHARQPDDDPLPALNAIAGVKLNVGSKVNWGSMEAKEAAKEALKAIRTVVHDVIKVLSIDNPDMDYRAAELVPHWHRLITLVQTTFRDVKSQQSALDFDDLERLTAELLSEHSQVVDRYRGHEFKHLLVDEFQDTNAAQWTIVKALAGLDRPGSMFVVGDQKQSIYAFRGADVSVFGSVRAEIKQKAGKSVQMARSFRTHHRLVQGFNAIFRHLLVREESSPVAAYQVTLDEEMDAFRKPAPDPAKPSIELSLIGQHQYDETGQPDTDRKGDVIELKADDRRAWEAAEIAQKINQMVADQRQVFVRVDDQDSTRPIEYGDIAVLMQSLTNVNVIEDAFKQAGIPFVTVAGRGYYDRQEVWDLMNLLAALYNPSDNLALASVLRSPMFGLSDDALFALRLQHHPEDDGGERMLLWEAIDQPGDLVPTDDLDRIERACECLYDLQAIAGRVTISELLRAALERTGFLAILSGLPDGNRRRGNVQKLLEKAQSGAHVSLSTFSQYLRDLSTREVREGEAPVDASGAVQIMSVHASKGLEFPLVILADAGWERGSSSTEPVVYDPEYGLCCRVYDADLGKLVKPFMYRHIQSMRGLREEAERLRLLYVAMTRAKDYVIISGRAQYKDDVWKSSGWLQKVFIALDLPHVLPPVGEQVVAYGWGDLLATIPARMPPPLRQQISDDETPGLASQAPDNGLWQPPLLKDMVVPRVQQVRHLSATQIAHLGSVDHAPDRSTQMRYSEYFRRQVMQDAPTQLRKLPDVLQRVSARQIGEIVHEALRHWYLPINTPSDKLNAVLQSYAWRQGITAQMPSAEAVRRAFRLLERFQVSPVYTWINEARQVFRELPFVYEHDGYVIHGVIDVLCQLPDERWVIVDYKTGAVPADDDKIAAHAKQYHLQVGMYAAAVEAQLGTVPETYVHFIQQAERPVPIPEQAWRAALDRKLDHRIQQLLEDETL